MRGPLLVIDASTYRGTVAVVEGTDVLIEREAQMRGASEERLMPAVADALRSAVLPLSQIGGIVCGAGPGSFTSLRIAASIAKGMAMAARRPMHSVSSMLLIVAGTVPAPTPGRYLAVLDAMRGDAFAARITVTGSGEIDGEGDAALIPATALNGIAEAEARTIVGPGRAADWWPRAGGVARLASSTMAVVDLATWEPTYGRLAEAQVAWEQKHGRRLSV